MTITPRTLSIIPSIVVVPTSFGVTQEPNYSQRVQGEAFVFAYRKTNGSDKRVRILGSGASVFGGQSIYLYYLDTEPKKEIVPVVSGGLDIKQNHSHSASLSKWWKEEFVAGNTAFNEGQTYSLNRYSFDILSSDELDAIASSTLYLDKKDLTTFSDNFKY